MKQDFLLLSLPRDTPLGLEAAGCGAWPPSALERMALPLPALKFWVERPVEGGQGRGNCEQRL